MPRRSTLTAEERSRLFFIPDNHNDLIRLYTFNEADLSLIKQRRGDANRLGFAIQLCYARHPCTVFLPGKSPDLNLVSFVSEQLGIDASAWEKYATRDETRREHLSEIQSIFGYKSFSTQHYQSELKNLEEIAWQTDKGFILASAFVQSLRAKFVFLPTINIIDKICAEAIRSSTRRIFEILTGKLSKQHKTKLDELLQIKDDLKITTLLWLRTPPGAPNAKHVLEHIQRLKMIEEFEFPDGLEKSIHQNRLLKLAREGQHMTPHDLARFEQKRRYATLVASLLETKTTIIDEVIDMHDRIIGALFNKAKRNHEKLFQQEGKAINDKVRLYYRIGNALMKAKETGTDPFDAIEAIIPWDVFKQTVTEAEKLSTTEDFDYLHRIGDNFSQVRRFSPAFLEAIKLKAAPAAKDLLDAVEIIKELNATNSRTLPNKVPTSFVRKRWKNLVFKENAVDRRFYELCVLAELKNALRSGDIWVKSSRQFKDFDEYLVSVDEFITLKKNKAVPLNISQDYNQYMSERIDTLEQQLEHVNTLAKADELPDAVMTESGLKITPQTNMVPEEANNLIRAANGLLPHIKITDLLQEVDEWTNFTRHFTHLKNNEQAKDKTLLLTVILADAINLGLTKMTESCPGSSYPKLAWLQAWHIRDETYSAALAELVNAQYKKPFASNWGEGLTSSSDGQRFRTGNRAEAMGRINPKYGSEPGKQFYTHISDQYAPFHTQVINVGVRDATYVLDGLLYHESDLHIEEHYTDTLGFTDHVFALMHLLGFRFAPRIRDLSDRRLYVPKNKKKYESLQPLIGGKINEKLIHAHWDAILRLATSIKQGTVTASLMLRKLGSYPRQNKLAVALRELGRIERTLFTLDWLQNIELRRRVNAGLNKGEARNALARAVFFNRLGELRDRSFQNQRYRASGLNLVTAAIILWNTVYLERAIHSLKKNGQPIDDQLLQHLSPLSWEHINLTGDYIWKKTKKSISNNFRPLRSKMLS